MSKTVIEQKINVWSDSLKQKQELKQALNTQLNNTEKDILKISGAIAAANEILKATEAEATSVAIASGTSDISPESNEAPELPAKKPTKTKK